MWGIQTRLSILDEEIGPGLGMYLLKHPFGLTPVLCKNWEELRGAKAPLALVGADFWEEAQAEQVKGSGTYLIRLDEAHVSPYQPADHLMKEVYRMALEQQLYLPGAMPVLYEKEIAAVCSPHGYDLQTGFAIVYSLIRAEHVRTLYLDFSYYSGFFDIEKEDVGDLFYELHKQNKPMGAILAAMVQKFGPMDYLPPVRVQMDMDDLTGEDFTELLQRILQESEYELVVLNMPVRPRFLRAVYGCCSHMYSLQREGILYERAQARLLEDLRLESGQTQLSNLQVVPMPAISGSFSMDESMYEELLFGEMAAFIRRMLAVSD
ncbi:MAG: hypothetical protein J6C00_13485 [Eubacterium sp.]|nr:hypothetical protein [Eubacterium sp.]